MAPTYLELLHQEWQWLVSECASAMHAARGNGASSEELRDEERRHGFRIDAAYARLKQAEAQNNQFVCHGRGDALKQVADSSTLY